MSITNDSQVTGLTVNTGNTTGGLIDNTKTTCWDYWQTVHYPQITTSYPVYIQERSRDKGKQAYEIVKVLKDKKLIDMKKVGDFIDIMDELIKIL